MLRNKISLNIIVIVSTIFAATMIIVALTGFGTAQGQADSTSLTSDQKAAMCDPNDSFVNSTESEICGVPKTIKPSISSSNQTSGIDTETAAPSVVPTPSDEG